jgi:hypothetical protein
MKAIDLLEKGESAVVVCTNGRNLRFSSDGFGSTGNWKVSPKRRVHKVVIYERDEVRNIHEVYVADHIGVSEPNARGRRVTNLAKIRSIGMTTNNWYEFAGEGQNPVRYVQS